MEILENSQFFVVYAIRYIKFKLEKMDYGLFHLIYFGMHDDLHSKHCLENKILLHHQISLIIGTYWKLILT